MSVLFSGFLAAVRANNEQITMSKPWRPDPSAHLQLLIQPLPGKISSSLELLGSLDGKAIHRQPRSLSPGTSRQHQSCLLGLTKRPFSVEETGIDKWAWSDLGPRRPDFRHA